ncbi:hypothetical protein H6G20_06105 [Desertifilum sp. FACHB-1129]|uniref:hypothetical protein n=1 Tax=unclassified Desertifilum TaxID=2621682 RepID=UPI0016857BDC|nr:MULTISPECIES: hypothetical protein [unclassified Desertifilum]MBD2311230.1 hypothetical protein [Desertifilum sp. FACHB-1129]MBD2324325.1 hypothetical protein [Desertifilum sp. FACHB-866]MBD2334339.1 hypothetical protein [Desertifilum sp. FACHB-868]MDA0213185.1 hypothetical protein [Cyanobacteria bacterium FC1]
MKKLIQSLRHRKADSASKPVSSACKVDASSTSPVKELVLHLPEKDYSKLSKLATHYCLTPAEYVTRRTFGRRTPQFIGSVLEQISQTLSRIEVLLEELIGVEDSQDNLYKQKIKLRSDLEQNLRQLSGFIKRLNRQFKL